MNNPPDVINRLAAWPGPRKTGRDVASLASDLLPPMDFVCLLLAAWSSTLLATHWLAPPDQSTGYRESIRQTALSVAVLAPFVLYDGHFGVLSRNGEWRALARSFGLRIILLSGLLLMLGGITGTLRSLPGLLLAIWVATALLLALLTRMVAARYIRHLQCRGALAGSIPDAGAARGRQTIHYVGDNLPVILLADRPIRRWDAVFKAMEDLVGGAIITLLLLPVLGAIALAVRLSSPGPVIFRQRRHALDNREFEIYKFRTMRWVPVLVTTDLQQTTRLDARITGVGRFLRATSLDELPQLFNVLQGDMSLVGPRPHAVDMRTEARLGSEITAQYAHRHRVKPGITGWSQVNGARGATDTTAQLLRRVDLDLHYIEHWSLALDLRILALTVRAVLRRTNAY